MDDRSFSPASGSSGASRPSVSRRLFRALAATALALLVVAGSGAHARAEDDDAADDPHASGKWAQALNGYLRDPDAHIDTVLEIEKAVDIKTLPPEIQVYIADAHLRAGHMDAAERILRDTVASNPEAPWDTFANLGLGATLMMQGDPQAAQEYFGAVASMPQQSSSLFGNLGLGHALLASGQPMDAKEAFDAAGANKVVDEQFRQAGRFGSASSLYAAGDYEGAAAAFDAIAKADPDGPIGTDARFAAARARLAAGDRAGATQALEAMSSRCPPEKRGRRSPRSLRNLDGRALGRAWLRNYQKMSLYEAMGTQTTMYTIGGCDLARATLRQIQARPAEAAAPSVQVASAVTSARPSEAGPAAAPGASTAAAPQTAAAPAASSWTTWVVATVVLAAGAILWLRRSRSR